LNRIVELVQYRTPDGSVYESRLEAEHRLAVIEVAELVNSLGLGATQAKPDQIARTLLGNAEQVVERLQAYLDSRPS
jgi:hypothetical protein